MNRSPTVDVKFSRIARVIECTDEAGVLYFTFDVSPAHNGQSKWNLHLSPRPLVESGKHCQHPSVQDSERIKAALREVEAYLTSKGYRVVVS